MTYKLIVNQPLQNAGNVLSTVFLFITKQDPFLKRLEDLWVCDSQGVSIIDKFNRQTIRVGVLKEEGEGTGSSCINIDGTCYKPCPDISMAALQDFIDVVNDNYGDCLMIRKSSIGYAYYLATP